MEYSSQEIKAIIVLLSILILMFDLVLKIFNFIKFGKKNHDFFSIQTSILDIGNKKFKLMFCIPDTWYEILTDYFEIGASTSFMSRVPPKKNDMVISFCCFEDDGLANYFTTNDVPKEFSVIKNYGGHSIFFQESFLMGKYMQFEGLISVKDLPGVYAKFIFRILCTSSRARKNRLHIFQTLISSFSIEEVFDENLSINIDEDYINFISECYKVFNRRKKFEFL